MFTLAHVLIQSKQNKWQQESIFPRTLIGSKQMPHLVFEHADLVSIPRSIITQVIIHRVHFIINNFIINFNVGHAQSQEACRGRCCTA